jgi:hypothetical protein
MTGGKLEKSVASNRARVGDGPACTQVAVVMMFELVSLIASRHAGPKNP